ncbi:MAG: hypothetical protein EBQ61_00980 [Micrococcales bacterium]|nr:hypothetical protein [Micrococcales bacterium]
MTLIEDQGRYGFREMGISRSGAFDQVSFRLANLLLGTKNEPAFEIIQGRFELETSSNAVVAIVGNAKVYVDSNIVSVNTSFQLLAKQRLLIEPIDSSPTYLVVAGIQVTKVLGSASRDTLSSLGPDAVLAGDQFEVNPTTALIGSFLSVKQEYQANVLHYIPGPMNIDVSGNWSKERVSRIGVRLNREERVESGSGNLASFPMMPGAIQVPPSGQPVILAVDSGTTGGYTVAGVVIEADLHKLARLVDNFSLEPVSLQYANNAKLQLEKTISGAVINPNQMGAW